jgi:selenide,water dikinase
MATEPIRLTKLAKRAGCAAKQPPGFLLNLLGLLPPITDPNVLVGSATADDAAVYKISDELALVLTTDFFTPIVDDPYDFGAVAAANALSDVYAMGGSPLAALSIVGFPDAALPPEVLVRILQGAGEKAAEAGIAIVGGHTIKSEEPIFGLAVVGRVAPDRVLANDKARAGDVLVLTKPLGLGIITTAAKNDEDKLGAIGEAIRVMTTLNRTAGEEMARHDVHALTDVTGFGLLGHLRNIVAAGHVNARVYFERVPVLAAARRYVDAGIAPGGTHANLKFLADWVTYADDVTKEERLILCDAQTSGGLLAAVAADDAEKLVAALKARGLAEATVVGRIEPGTTGRIFVDRRDAV